MKQQGNLQTIHDTRQNQTDATTKLNEKKKKKKKRGNQHQVIKGETPTIILSLNQTISIGV